jgi:crotonobetainyl-CoA:carnitine CoA-transferase CaiB-like acyl-CoA transferase
VRVIDLTQVLAGPTAARTLAEFGADVVKVNNPREEGAGYRWQVHRYHTDVNRGKRTILLDLKSPDGLDVFRRLAAGADVVLQNFRPGVADRLGVGYEQVRGLAPGVVYGTVGFLGEGGPWAAARAMSNAQAACGMMARMAGASGVPAMQPYAVNDYATGLLGALGLALALFHRRRGGKGQHVQTSLAAAATFLQSAYLHDHRGKVSLPESRAGEGWLPKPLTGEAWEREPAGPEALGWGPLQRLYRASDGWLFLGAGAADLARLDAVAGLGGIAALRGDALASALEARLAMAPAAEWVAPSGRRGSAHRRCARRVAHAGRGWSPTGSASRGSTRQRA